METYPLYERIWRCIFLNHRKWKLARAYSKVAVNLLHSNNSVDRELGQAIREKSDQIWAEIYE